jgi:hypothetical protein
MCLIVLFKKFKREVSCNLHARNNFVLRYARRIEILHIIAFHYYNRITSSSLDILYLTKYIDNLSRKTEIIFRYVTECQRPGFHKNNRCQNVQK